LFCGDVVGRSGRTVLIDNLPRLRSELALDFVVANAENAARGFGMTESICEDLFDAGCYVITGGNHTFDRAEIITYLERNQRVLRPDNYAAGTPGRGHGVFDTPDGRRVLVINVICRLFMETSDDPFAALARLLPDGPPVRSGLDAVIVDVHGEASSEKMALGHVADGTASLVVGTHTHVPTADAHILPGGTAYQTDAGMCGDYDSVIGMEKQAPIDRFLGRVPRPRLAPAEGAGTLCGVFVETDDKTGLAKAVAPVRTGGLLSEAVRPFFKSR